MRAESPSNEIPRLAMMVNVGLVKFSVYGEQHSTVIRVGFDTPDLGG